ncbi:MAG: hypothetical protein OXI73_00825, partial [Rhodospirillales bacterium]|nr:hypothetical protein [Rhodospirillales bacterium]
YKALPLAALAPLGDGRQNGVGHDFLHFPVILPENRGTATGILATRSRSSQSLKVSGSNPDLATTCV